MTERDGSFRRLVEMVKEQQVVPSGRPGRPPKNRVPTTGHFASHIHARMKKLAEMRSQEVDHVVSATDLYNEAAQQLITDLHQLLGNDFRLPGGAVSIPGILGLREMIDRPVLTPLRDLEFQAVEQLRTTLYLDPPIWDTLMELSLRFGLQMRRPIHVHRLLELSAAWYLVGIKTEPD